jgi:hypothetical protein
LVDGCENHVASENFCLCLRKMSASFIDVLGSKTKINHSYFMHRVLIILVISHQYIIKFHVVVDIPTFMDSLKNVNYFYTKLVNGFVAEIHIELIEVTIKITTELLHDVKRHKLFTVFDALLD